MSRTETAVDMNPDAIARRLWTISELYDFARTLKGVKWLGKAKDLQNEQERVLGLGPEKRKEASKEGGVKKSAGHEGQKGLFG